MNPTKENKHATIKLPYAYSLSQKRMVHITLAMQLSREEKYICDSCGMEVRPRGGDGKLVVEHFYHKEKAKQECKVSPWVSLRSMALQILDESAAIAIPGGIILNSVSSCITPLNIKNSSTGHDRHCISSFGEYTIHFLTPEHPLQSLPGEYFYDKAILSIDLEEVFNVDIKEQDAFLRDTVLLLNEYKKWHIPHKSLNVYQEEILSQEEAEKEIQRFEEEEKKRLELEERWKQNQEIRMKNLKRQLLESKEKEDKSNYIIARSLEISSEEFSKFDKKDLDSLKRMKNFFNWMVEDKEYYIPKGSSFALMKKGNNLWGYWAYDQIYCVVLLHSTYYMYQYKNGKFLFIKRAYGIFSLEEYLKEMVQTKQEADSLF